MVSRLAVCVIGVSVVVSACQPTSSVSDPNAHWHRVNKLNWHEYSDQTWQFEADSGDIVCDENPKFGTVVYFYPLSGTEDDAIPLNDGAVRLDAELGKPPRKPIKIRDSVCKEMVF